MRVPFCVSQAERGTPGAAQHQPSVDPEVPPEKFHVRDQVLGRVDGQIRGRIARVRSAPAAAALVEEDDPVDVGIEISAHARGTSRAGTAMEDDRGLAARVAADLPIDEVPVADVEHAVVVRLDFGVEL